MKYVQKIGWGVVGLGFMYGMGSFGLGMYELNSHKKLEPTMQKTEVVLQREIKLNELDSLKTLNLTELIAKEMESCREDISKLENTTMYQQQKKILIEAEDKYQQERENIFDKGYIRLYGTIGLILIGALGVLGSILSGGLI